MKVTIELTDEEVTEAHGRGRYLPTNVREKLLNAIAEQRPIEVGDRVWKLDRYGFDLPKAARVPWTVTAIDANKAWIKHQHPGHGTWIYTTADLTELERTPS